MNWYKKAQQNRVNLQSILPSYYKTELGSCMLAAQYLTIKLIKMGITNFEVIEGYVRFGYDYDTQCMHTWINYNGKILDPTKKQFKKWGFYLKDMVYYSVKNTYAPLEYLKKCKNCEQDVKKEIKKYIPKEQQSEFKKEIKHELV